ncbi:MAG: hypothetical protein PHP74_02145, partial [Candidatus Gracilibacteria bacterium]|nr:hypothetical protein [Candidatus Gracilibacteria bacterium]
PPSEEDDSNGPKSVFFSADELSVAINFVFVLSVDYTKKRRFILVNGLGIRLDNSYYLFPNFKFVGNDVGKIDF